ncbi:alpha/beta hydrolase [Nonomuraea sp. KC401]|uniref:alpha/beta fold hydrolase n=1 Tax=unclassified Nonomuraea TaxID=2593643 RepID=UPI0010FE35DA|nr:MULTISPECIES: alpha/beta hydrolase [unclassified Nonomuraea]NBE92751.1 alpha/beta fold hydrolase [Nonomuraea sp. K271]TLF61858.1 alpha/beta hydrolase [Nonomuraea sp. KC401]
MTTLGTTIGDVTSKDGTTIGYLRLGRGPGLVFVHGAMQVGRSQIELAQALSDDFTCYLPDRRGRGGSGPYGCAYSVEREVEDLDALLAATGARYAVGISSGAIITLRTALTGTALDKIVLFQPPLDIAGSNPTDWLSRFDRELAAGDTTAALVTAMRATRMGPSIVMRMPRFLLEGLTVVAQKGQEKAGADGEPTFSELAPTLHHDVQVVAETATAGDPFAYRSVGAEVLLLGGGKSPAYLRTALDALQRVLPRARRVEMAGLGHSATANTARRGRPERVAPEIRAFLA